MEDEILDYNWVIAQEVKLPVGDTKLLTRCINLDILIATCRKLKDHKIAYQIIEAENHHPEEWNTIHEIHIERNQLEAAEILLTQISEGDLDLVTENGEPIDSNKNVEANFWLIMIFLAIVSFFLILGTR